MRKILFLCHGNICRSPMAEFIMKKCVKDLNKEKEFEINSKALSNEEIGNDIYPLAKDCLKRHNVTFQTRSASRFTLDDYHYYDEIYIMDDSNLRIIMAYTNNDPLNKIKMLNGYIEDPWYTDNFDKVFDQIKQGITRIIQDKHD